MRDEKLIREILAQYEFDYEMDMEYRNVDIEQMRNKAAWIKCLRWVLGDMEDKQ